MNESLESNVRCLASPLNRWLPGRVHRVNEDGTYDIEFDEKPNSFMPLWYGLTKQQVSIDDNTLWDTYFSTVAAGAGMTRDLFARELDRIGFATGDDELSRFWSQHCTDSYVMYLSLSIPIEPTKSC